MLPARKKSKGKSKKDKDEEAEVEQLKKELAFEKEGKDEVEWVANELEKQLSQLTYLTQFLNGTAHNGLSTSHRHLSNIDCLTVCTTCLVCFISTVNKKEALEDRR